MDAIVIILGVLAVYLAIGVLVGAVYLLRAAPRADPALADSAAHVRLLLLPGAVAVWPLLLVRRTAEPEATP